MRIDIITVLPELLRSPFDHSILKRAADKGLLEINIVNLRDHSTFKHNQVDDYQFGGGAGMVMMVEPIFNCINSLKAERNYDEVIYLTTDVETFNQNIVNRLSLCKNIIILCGNYKGVDDQVRPHLITNIITIAELVLTGT